MPVNCSPLWLATLRYASHSQGPTRARRKVAMELEKDVYVPMRDSVCLAADVYHPDGGEDTAGVLLVTPYLKDAVFDAPLGADGRPVPLPLPPLPPGVNPMLLSVRPLVE